MKSFFLISILSLVFMATLVAFQTPPRNNWNILQRVKIRSTYDTISNDYKFDHKYTKSIQRRHQKSVTLTGYLNHFKTNKTWLTQHPDCFSCVSPPSSACIIVLNNLEQPFSNQSNQYVTLQGILHLQPHKIYPYAMSNVQMTVISK